MLPIRDHNPSTRVPLVTWTLIAINVALHLWLMAVVRSDGQLMQLYYDWALIPQRLAQLDNPVALLSATFLHGGLLHLGGNMLFLFIFGDNLEEEMGHGGFLAFYLGAGVAANLVQFAAAPWSPVPVIGASGAIAGVMGGYLLLFPRARVDILIFLVVFVRVIPVPAWIMLGLWFGLQLLGGVASDAASGGVAYWAHAGGFVIGLGLALPLWLRRGALRFWRRTHGQPPHPPSLAHSNIPIVRRRK